jgi:hypothetical protein
MLINRRGEIIGLTANLTPAGDIGLSDEETQRQFLSKKSKTKNWVTEEGLKCRKQAEHKHASFLCDETVVIEMRMNDKWKWQWLAWPKPGQIQGN